MHTTTVKLPEVLHQKLLEAVIRDGYGMKGKSTWVKEAIADLLSRDGYHDFVDIADEMRDLKHSVTFRLNAEMMHAIDKAIIKTRSVYPSMEGVKSNIIRASIIQRLMK